jgi:hypothetical protein
MCLELINIACHKHRSKMSSIKKRGNKYQVQIRTQGQKITQMPLIYHLLCTQEI